MKEKNYLPLFIVIILLLIIIIAFLGFRLVEVEKNIQQLEYTISQKVSENNMPNQNQFINEISTIKGTDKDYTVLKLKESFSDSRGDKFYEYYFIIDDSKQDSIGVFINDTMADIEVDGYTGHRVQINEDNIIEYKVAHNDEDELILRKWKYTIENGTIKQTLEQEYTKDQFTEIGKKSI